MRRLSLVTRLLLPTVIALTTALAGAPAANASASAVDAYAPERISHNRVEGRANLITDCSNTIRCKNYIKIERKNGVLPPRFVAGAWRNTTGVASVAGTLQMGCYEYRTWVDSYNWVVGTTGAGVQVASTGFTRNGEKIYKYKLTWNSGWKQHCR